MDFDLQREIRIYGRQTELARDLGVSRSYVSSVYKGHRPPSEELLSKLGWERVTLIQRIKERQS